MNVLNEVVTGSAVFAMGMEEIALLHEDLIRVNNNLLVLSALLSILVAFIIIKEFFNRR